MGLIKSHREEKDRLEQIKANTQRVIDLDKKLIDALYAPAVAEHDTADGVDQAILQRLIGWKDERLEKGRSKEDREDLRAIVFRESIFELSQFYMEKNPVLSAALWGIWNTSDYLKYNADKGKGFLSKQPIPIPDLFEHYRALVATAAVQFADGTAYTFNSRTAIIDPDGNESAI